MPNPACEPSGVDLSVATCERPGADPAVATCERPGADPAVAVPPVDPLPHHSQPFDQAAQRSSSYKFRFVLNNSHKRSMTLSIRKLFLFYFRKRRD